MLPFVGNESSIRVDANFAVFNVASADVPPTTMARW
jgi:hypothetical protein